MELHSDRRIAGIILAAFVIPFVAVGIMALLEGADPVSHLFDLLLHDRVVQLIMIDFVFFFVWVVLWMIDLGRREKRNVLVWIPLGLIAGTLMITLFVLSNPRKTERPSAE